MFSYQSPLWVFSSRGRLQGLCTDAGSDSVRGLRPRRQTGAAQPHSTVPASLGLCTLLPHVCYRSHSTLTAGSQLPFKGIWIIIQMSLTLTRVAMLPFPFCRKNPPLYLVGQVCWGCVLSSGASGQLYAAISGSLFRLAQYPRWTGLSATRPAHCPRGGSVAVSPCLLKGKPSSRAYLKALLFVTGFDYDVFCVLGSWGLTELLGSVVLECPSNWENCSCVLQAQFLPRAVQDPCRHAGLQPGP